MFTLLDGLLVQRRVAPDEPSEMKEFIRSHIRLMTVSSLDTQGITFHMH